MSLNVESPEAVGFSSKRLARIKPVLQAYVDKRGFSGFSTLVARRGQVIHFEQVGWQERETQTPMAADTLFRIYSMTKPIICTAFMTLYEEARFQLFDPVAKFIPAFAKLCVLIGSKEAGFHEVALMRPVTILDLLTHTSGLTYHFLNDSPVSKIYRESQFASPEHSLAKMIDGLLEVPLAYQPGTRWHYGVSIDVVARLIEIISGQTLQQFLQERIFDPLGMVDTGFFVPPEKRTRVATMYGLPDIFHATLDEIGKAWVSGYNQRLDLQSSHPMDNADTFARGGYGLFSTTEDFFRFAQMLLNRGQLDGVRILAPRIVDMLHTNYLPKSLLPFEIGGIPSTGLGFGLGSAVVTNVAETGVPGSVGEFGWGGAAKTNYWVDPQQEMVCILMAQYMAAIDQPDSDFRVLVHQALLE